MSLSPAGIRDSWSGYLVRVRDSFYSTGGDSESFLHVPSKHGGYHVCSPRPVEFAQRSSWWPQGYTDLGKKGGSGLTLAKGAGTAVGGEEMDLKLCISFSCCSRDPTEVPTTTQTLLPPRPRVLGEFQGGAGSQTCLAGAGQIGHARHNAWCCGTCCHRSHTGSEAPGGAAAGSRHDGIPVGEGWRRGVRMGSRQTDGRT